jgi:acetoin utilization deacetylase AcuC-like enzyme
MGLPVVYTKDYHVDIGDHVFPTLKYEHVLQRLLAEGIVEEADVQQPTPASDEDVLRVHTPAYVAKLRSGRLSPQEILLLELPWSHDLVRASFLAAGGSIRAAQLALDSKLAAHIGGGFHHAFPDHGEGFCVLHDVAIAARRLQVDGGAARMLIVDCDVHHGNGTAAIFANDPSVVTFSIHQENNYPAEKPPSDVDVGLDDRAGGAEYMAALRAHLPRLLEQGRPEVVFYVAGADPYIEDQLGGLALTLADLADRDRFVIETSRDAGAAVMITFAGGYARRLEDTVAIHAQTVRFAADRHARERQQAQVPDTRAADRRR